MLHDNDDGTVPIILPTDITKRKFPAMNGLYAVKCKNDIVVGLVYYYDKQWLSYPSKFSLDTLSINSQIEFCIGPIPDSV